MHATILTDKANQTLVGLINPICEVNFYVIIVGRTEYKALTVTGT